MQRGVGLSRFIEIVVVPLCLWGLISTLVLHLIEVRSVFIAGAENKLRLATLAFALGVILIQILSKSQGPSIARAYSVAIGVAMTSFALYVAVKFRLPVPWPIVFVVNVILFGVLAWAGWKLSAACSIDSEAEVATAGESGILPEVRILNRRKREKEDEESREELWKERLPARHPGRVILYFSLFALPAFGLGIYIFDMKSMAGLRLGALLFGYLWCALALLFLSSLGQVRAYFEKRKVSLPEEIGLTWLSLGFFAVTAVLLLAYFLPQPASVPTLFIRDRVRSVYTGWESSSGIKDTSAGRPSRIQQSPDRPLDSTGAKQLAEEKNPGGGDDKLMNDVRSNERGQYDNYLKLKSGANSGLRQLVDGVLKAIFIVAIIAGLVVIYALVMSFWRGISEGFSGVVWKRKQRKPKRPKKRKKGEEGPLPVRFRKFANPFLGPYSMSNGDEIVRYIWQAVVAFCADAGSPCPPEQTPGEFVKSRPEALNGFEEQARFIADLFTFSEYSGRAIPEEIFPELKSFWTALEKHASRAF